MLKPFYFYYTMKFVLVDYFSTILLRYDSHAIQFADSKLAIHFVCVFLVYSDMCSNLQTIIKHFITSKGNSVFCDSHLFNLFSLYPSLSNYLFFSLYIFYFLIILCECNYKSCDIFDYFIYHIVSRFICLVCIRTSLLL